MPATSYAPDVVLTHDISKPGVYKAVVVVLGFNGQYAPQGCYIFTYEIHGVGTGSLSANIVTGGQLGNAKWGTVPHIDAWADPNFYIDGHPSVHKVAAVFTSFSTGAIWGYFNEVNVAPWTIPVPSPSAPLPGYFGDNVDVAAYTDMATGQQRVVLAYLNGTNSLWYREYNVSAAGVFPPNLLQTATNIWMPRVEAMSLYTAGTGAKWQIAALVNSNVKGYNVLNPTGFVVADAWDYYLPAVGCAVGKLSPAPNNVGNENYLIGFHAAASDNFVRNVDVSSGLIPNNDWYQVNSGVVNYAAYTSMFAISSSSNSGNGILTAWFDGNDIIYKESPNFIQFRTTGVNNTGRLAEAITTYPNPAREKLYVNGAGNTSSYTITSLSGATVSSGMYRENGIDIRALPAGMYILQLRESEQTRSVTFTKS